jgi:hypothetical protein
MQPAELDTQASPPEWLRRFQQERAELDACYEATNKVMARLRNTGLRAPDARLGERLARFA